MISYKHVHWTHSSPANVKQTFNIHMIQKVKNKEHCHSGNGSTAAEYWNAFLSLQAANVVLSQAETLNHTFSLPSWSWLFTSAPSVALLTWQLTILYRSGLLDSTLLATNTWTMHINTATKKCFLIFKVSHRCSVDCRCLVTDLQFYFKHNPTIPK